MWHHEGLSHDIQLAAGLEGPKWFHSHGWLLGRDVPGKTGLTWTPSSASLLYSLSRQIVELVKWQLRL